jgi:hypothetical protein
MGASMPYGESTTAVCKIRDSFALICNDSFGESINENIFQQLHLFAVRQNELSVQQQLDIAKIEGMLEEIKPLN